ncbi:MarR family winged helix-turn-helix transcriptional regulator [Bacillus sp. UNCCL81]|uniref:MarR family winged helix-turn-helix transcriptional regulator n=1 Tax=Bacillus sp. UNCCL81 TaxID=1502755 RepID=UPI0008E3B392|nr:MarR family winged helix-turn-helix transcriptional regulator [Bacillus sp. UNCCL81]SFD12125.1 DNA-binding transcriptional regulator, MarR family [Bacillus sp. UNCCL81]
MDNSVLFSKCVSFITSVHRVTHELTKNSKSGSITPIQYKILEYITVSQPVTPSEISDCQNISMPNTSRELKKLSEKNLIEKMSDPADRRKQFIRLTVEGEAMMSESFKSLESLLLSRIQNASKEDLQDIEHAMEILQTKVFY